MSEEYPDNIQVLNIAYVEVLVEKVLSRKKVQSEVAEACDSLFYQQAGQE